MVRGLQITYQVMILAVISAFGDWLCHAFHLPVPGSIVGLVLLFVLLQLKIIRVENIEQGVNFLLTEMLLFFVPSAVGITQYGHLMEQDGLRLLATIACSTVIVMLGTGLVTEHLYKAKTQSDGGDLDAVQTR